eukprot:2233542-Pleurochrysis_carterae.AAC.2
MAAPTKDKQRRGAAMLHVPAPWCGPSAETERRLVARARVRRCARLLEEGDADGPVVLVAARHERERRLASRPRRLGRGRLRLRRRLSGGGRPCGGRRLCGHSGGGEVDEEVDALAQERRRVQVDEQLRLARRHFAQPDRRARAAAGRADGGRADAATAQQIPLGEAYGVKEGRIRREAVGRARPQLERRVDAAARRVPVARA